MIFLFTSLAWRFFTFRLRARGTGGTSTVSTRLISPDLQDDEVQRAGNQAHVSRLQGALPQRDGEGRHFQDNLWAIFSSGRFVSVNFSINLNSCSAAASESIHLALHPVQLLRSHLILTNIDGAACEWLWRGGGKLDRVEMKKNH